jgi:hypothetical protein
MELQMQAKPRKAIHLGIVSPQKKHRHNENRYDPLGMLSCNFF